MTDQRNQLVFVTGKNAHTRGLVARYGRTWRIRYEVPRVGFMTISPLHSETSLTVNSQNVTINRYTNVA